MAPQDLSGMDSSEPPGLSFPALGAPGPGMLLEVQSSQWPLWASCTAPAIVCLMSVCHLSPHMLDCYITFSVARDATRGRPCKMGSQQVLVTLYLFILTEKSICFLKKEKKPPAVQPRQRQFFILSNVCLSLSTFVNIFK